MANIQTQSSIITTNATISKKYKWWTNPIRYKTNGCTKIINCHTCLGFHLLYFDIGNCHRQQKGWIWLLKEFLWFGLFILYISFTVCTIRLRMWLNDGLSSGWRLTFGQNELRIEYTYNNILLLLVGKALSRFASLCGLHNHSISSNLTIAQDMKWNCGDCIKTFKLNLYLKIV